MIEGTRDFDAPAAHLQWAAEALWEQLEPHLPGVSVELTNDATGQSRTAVTESDGFYRVPLVQPGRYSVKATLSDVLTATVKPAND